MRRRADELDSALLGPLVRSGAGERREERAVDVDHRGIGAAQEVARQDRHVARQHDEGDPPGDELQLALLNRGLRLATHRDLRVRHADDATSAAGSGWVGDDLHDLNRQLAAPPSPQQVEQAVVVAGDEHRDGGRHRHVPHPERHAEPGGDVGGEPALQLRQPVGCGTWPATGWTWSKRGPRRSSGRRSCSRTRRSSCRWWPATSSGWSRREMMAALIAGRRDPGAAGGHSDPYRVRRAAAMGRRGDRRRRSLAAGRDPRRPAMPRKSAGRCSPRS